MTFLKMLIRPQLDISEWLNNILFGLIMVLTTTALMGTKPMATPAPCKPSPVAGSVDENPGDTSSGGDDDDSSDETPQSIVKQVVGCNVAWGIINGGLLILDRLYMRGRTDRLRRAIRKATSEDEALAIIEDENEWDLDEMTSPEARRQLYSNVLQQAKVAAPVSMRVSRQDIADAIVTGLVVAATVLPVVLAVELLKDSQIGFRVGNGASVLIMFFVGYFWARETNVNPWRTGLAMVLFGAAAVGVAWSMGG